MENEQNNYYPFGLQHAGYNKDVREVGFWDYAAMTQQEIIENAQYFLDVVPIIKSDYKYKYNGQEWQDELNLNVTSMDFRQYDNAIGRFLNPDALSELEPMYTPYRFAFNNPVYWRDPTGLFENENFAYCPTCPNTPEFQPYIDDPINTFKYDTETKAVKEIIELERMVVKGTKTN